MTDRTGNRENKRCNRRSGAALAIVLLTLMMVLAFIPSVSNGGYVAIAEDGADAAVQEEQAAEPLAETGEAVKCQGGTLVAPVGSPDAPAPEIKARSAALYSFDLGSIVYGKNEDEVLEPYSMTKLLTCWLALENLDMDQVVTVSEEATQEYANGTTIWLKPGEKITVRDLIYGAMLESGNDAAYALGEAVSGSEAEFAELMNKTVEGWGCRNTHFVNANGWKHKDHYSTARDMAIIAAKCLENKELMEISAAKTYKAEATNKSGAREMKNYFLAVAKNAEPLTGGKSGTWDDDDCAIAAAFSERGLSEVMILMGDTDKGRPKDVRTLIGYSHEVTPGFAVPAAGSTVETAWIRHGEKTRVGLTADETTYAYPARNRAKDIRTETRYDKLEAPVRKGEAVGEFLVYSDDTLIAEHKLVAMEDIGTGWLLSYLYISNQATLNILKVLGALLLIVLLLILLRRRRRPAVAGSGRSVESSSGSGRTDKRVSRKSTSREKREARRRLREKYREKH